MNKKTWIIRLECEGEVEWIEAEGNDQYQAKSYAQAFCKMRANGREMKAFDETTGEQIIFRG